LHLTEERLIVKRKKSYCVYDSLEGSTAVLNMSGNKIMGDTDEIKKYDATV
jgi:hypothetical protein